MNWKLLIQIFVLLVFGFTILYSATQISGSTEGMTHLFYRQLIWFGIGLITFLIAYSTSPRFFLFITPFLYFFSILALGLILILPPNTTGTHRWLNLGFVRFQPSELAKIATIFMLAHYFSLRTKSIENLRETIVPILIAIIPFGLILIEPDLGTALSLIPLVIAILFWGGLSSLQIILLLMPLGGLIAIYSVWLWLIFLFIVLVLLLRIKADFLDNILIFSTSIIFGIVSPYLWSHLRDYQRQRILTFLDPDKDPLGAGYQIIQSRVAIGSGGLTGKGLLEGTQKKLAFLPEQHTDFIFSVMGEEIGLIGIMIFFILYSWILIQFIEIAQKTSYRFSSYVVIGITVMLFTHILINVGMTLGVLPVVGLPLPLISYGGSSLVTTLFSIGVVFSVDKRKNLYF